MVPLIKIDSILRFWFPPSKWAGLNVMGGIGGGRGGDPIHKLKSNSLKKPRTL